MRYTPAPCGGFKKHPTTWDLEIIKKSITTLTNTPRTFNHTPSPSDNIPEQLPPGKITTGTKPHNRDTWKIMPRFVYTCMSDINLCLVSPFYFRYSDRVFIFAFGFGLMFGLLLGLRLEIWFIYGDGGVTVREVL